MRDAPVAAGRRGPPPGRNEFRASGDSALLVTGQSTGKNKTAL